MDWYSHGTEVDIRAPTQRSLCFFLWFMYCKTLKEKLVLCSGICSWGFGHNEIRVGSASPAPLGSVLYKELNSGTSPRSFSKAQSGRNVSSQNSQVEDLGLGLLGMAQKVQIQSSISSGTNTCHRLSSNRYQNHLKSKLDSKFKNPKFHISAFPALHHPTSPPPAVFWDEMLIPNSKRSGERGWQSSGKLREV